MNRIQLIRQVLPLLYDARPKRKNYARSSYGMKHEVEDALSFYITNDELIEAAVSLGYAHTQGDPNYTFYVKSKWSSSVLHYAELPSRPKGVRKDHWEAFHDARKKIDDMVRFLIQHDTSDDSRFTKLAKVVG